MQQTSRVPQIVSRSSLGEALFRVDGFGDAASLLIVMFGLIEFKLVGQLFVGDFLFVCVLAYLIPRRGKDLLQTRCALILMLTAIWLASQIATDLVRGSDPQDFLRGWAKIVTFGINFAAAFLLLRTERRMVLYIIGLSIGLLAKNLYEPIEAAGRDPWKWAYGWPISMLFVVAATMAYKRRTKTLPTVFIFAASSLNFYFNYRSMALFCFATGCCLILSSRVSSRPTVLKVLSTAVALTALIWIFSGLYGYVAQNGYLGRKAQEKYEMQAAGDGGLLLASRDESLAYTQAIKDSPILGHGSWAKDPQYAQLVRSSLAERGYRSLPSEQDTIPTHSHLAGAWVDAGVFGTLVWLYVLYITCKGLTNLLMCSVSIRPLCFFALIWLLWDVLFSPFGGDRVLYTPVLIVSAIFSAKLTHRRKKPVRPGEFAFETISSKKVNQVDNRYSHHLV